MRSLTIDVDGPLHVADFGGSGPPMVLVHGLGGSHVNWLSVAPRLALTHRVFALDLPGFGLSPAAGRRSTVPANVALLARAVGELSDRPVVLIGCSMGGALSLGVAAARPDRVAALILANAALPVPRGNRFALESLAREYLLAYFPQVAIWRVRRLIGAGGAEGLVRSTLADCTVHFDRIDPAVLEAHIEMERTRLAHPRWQEPLREATGSLLSTLAERAMMRRWLQRVTVPTLLTHGSRDRVVSLRAAEAAASARPDWEFHVFEDTGHLPILEAPREFADAVQTWLDRQRVHPASVSAAVGLAG